MSDITTPAGAFAAVRSGELDINTLRELRRQFTGHGGFFRNQKHAYESEMKTLVRGDPRKKELRELRDRANKSLNDLRDAIDAQLESKTLNKVALRQSRRTERIAKLEAKIQKLQTQLADLRSQE